MKDAVDSAIAQINSDKASDNADESYVVREALAEYLTKRGYLSGAAPSASIAEDEPAYRIAAKRKQTGDPLAKAGRQMKRVSKAKKQSGKRSDAA